MTVGPTKAWCPCGCGLSKWCPKCERSLSMCQFWNDKRRKDGKRAWCRDCDGHAYKTWRAANYEHRNAYEYAWHQSHPEVWARAGRKWRTDNPEAERERHRAWRERNIEKARAYNATYLRGWRGRNPARSRAHDQRKRAIRVGAPGRATADQVAARVEFYGYRCWICGRDWECIDHVKPLARGGTHWPANLRPACRMCNAIKAARWWQ